MSFSGSSLEWKTAKYIALTIKLWFSSWCERSTILNWGYWFLRSYKRGGPGEGMLSTNCGIFLQRSKGLMPYNLVMPLNCIGTLQQRWNKCHGCFTRNVSNWTWKAVLRKHLCNRLRDSIFPVHLEEMSLGRSVTMRILYGIWLSLLRNILRSEHWVAIRFK